ncbi:MAG: hypothetical protein WCC64_09580 [Aliidongia sp.]
MPHDTIGDDDWLRPPEAVIRFGNASNHRAFVKAYNDLKSFPGKCGFREDFLRDPHNPKWPRPHWDGYGEPDYEWERELLDERSEAVSEYKRLSSVYTSCIRAIDELFVVKLIEGKLIAKGTPYSSATEAVSQQSVIAGYRWRDEPRLDVTRGAAILRIDGKIAFVGILIRPPVAAIPASCSKDSIEGIGEAAGRASSAPARPCDAAIQVPMAGEPAVGETVAKARKLSGAAIRDALRLIYNDPQYDRPNENQAHAIINEKFGSCSRSTVRQILKEEEFVGFRRGRGQKKSKPSC